MSKQVKQIILDKHNELRRKVARGHESNGNPGPQYAAEHMWKFVRNTVQLDLDEQIFI